MRHYHYISLIRIGQTETAIFKLASFLFFADNLKSEAVNLLFLLFLLVIILSFKRSIRITDLIIKPEFSFQIIKAQRIYILVPFSFLRLVCLLSIYHSQLQVSPNINQLRANGIHNLHLSGCQASS